MKEGSQTEEQTRFSADSLSSFVVFADVFYPTHEKINQPTMKCEHGPGNMTRLCNISRGEEFDSSPNY